ncbi:hypothetical protein V3M53_01530 [Trueperella pyogenes]
MPDESKTPLKDAHVTIEGDQYTVELAMTYLLSCCNIRLFLVQNSFSSLILILSMIFRNSQQ